MPATTTTPTVETYPARVRRETAYALGRSRLQPLIGALRRQLTARIEFAEFRQFLQGPGNLEQVQRERAGRIFWVILAGIAVLTIVFDICFTFSSTAASLRDQFSRILSAASGRLDFLVSAALALTILAITIAIRIATETAQDRQRLNTISADSPEIPDLIASVRRRQQYRTGWAAVLAAFLAAAALSDVLTIQAYQGIVDSSRGGTSTTAPGKADNSIVTGAASGAAILALVTPYGVTFVLHTLLLFLPLPSSSPFLRYPCAPSRIDALNRRVEDALRETGRRIYDVVLSVPDETARRQLVGDLGEDERAAVNQALGRTVFQATVPAESPNGTPGTAGADQSNGPGTPPSGETNFGDVL